MKIKYSNPIKAEPEYGAKARALAKISGSEVELFKVKSGDEYKPLVTAVKRSVLETTKALNNLQETFATGLQNLDQGFQQQLAEAKQMHDTDLGKVRELVKSVEDGIAEMNKRYNL